MLFWTIFIVMLAGASLCVLYPLSRKREIGRDEEAVIALYRDQLLQLDADDPQRPELERRLLDAGTDISERNGSRSGRLTILTASILALFVLPFFSVATYVSLGSPGASGTVGDVQSRSLDQRPVDELIFLAEKQLEQQPDDLRGWSLLADVYGKTNRPEKRARALRNIVRISGPTASLLAELGEAMIAANANVVTGSARDVLLKAVAMNAKEPKANAYLALALEQEGKREAAIARWQSLANVAKEDSQWKARALYQVARLRNEIGIMAGPQPDKERVAAAEAMTNADRSDMILGMVERLSSRLQASPDDIDGWLRLIRSLHVLQKQDDLLVAWRRAQSIFEGQQTKLAQLDVLARDLGYSTQGTELVKTQ